MTYVRSLRAYRFSRAVLVFGLMAASASCADRTEVVVVGQDAGSPDAAGGRGGEALGADGGTDASKPADVDTTSVTLVSGGWLDRSGPLVFCELQNGGTSTIALTTLDAWFENGAPVTVTFPQPLFEFEGRVGRQDTFRMELSNGDVFSIALSLNSSGRVTPYAGNAKMSPFAVGTLHLVMRGTFEDTGRAWEASATLVKDPQ